LLFLSNKEFSQGSQKALVYGILWINLL